MISRRAFIPHAASVVALSAISSAARAQAYPSRPVRIIVGFAPGGPNDILARLIAPRLSERLGQPFVIENRPGAGGNVGTEVVARAPPDGHTLLLGGVSNAINTTLYEKNEVIRDIAPVATLVRQPLAMLVGPSVPARSVPEFIAYAKASLGKVNYASAGIGTAPHVAAELFKMTAGIEMTHVPYRSGALALTDLLGGQVQVTFIGVAAVLEQIRSGAVRALAVTTATRWAAMLEIPPAGEFAPGYEASAWFGVFVSKGTPEGIVQTLNKEVNAVLSEPTTSTRLADLGGGEFLISPADFARFMTAEVGKWGRVIRAANIKPE